MKRYSHRQAAKLIRQKKKQLAAKARTQKSSLPVSGAKPAKAGLKAPSSVKSIQKRATGMVPKRASRGLNLSSGWLIGGGIFIFVVAAVLIAFFVFDVKFTPNKNATVIEAAEAESAEAPEKAVATNGLKTDFVRSAITSNMMINASGNFITVENSDDYYFMDIVFRETSPSGELINKKVIPSEYTLFTYNTRHCNDIIEVNDGYLLVGYTQRGDYANGNSDISLWYAKIDHGANLVWEHVIDDGYLKSQALTITDLGNDEYQLFVRTESLKGWFMSIDANGEKLSEQDLNEDFITYAKTSDGGKVFVKERNKDISLIKKADANDTETFENMIVGRYEYIFEVPEGYLLFGYKEIDLQTSTVAVLIDKEANVLWEKKISSYGQPTIKDVLYKEGEGYFLVGYIYATQGTSESRVVQSLFDTSEQQKIEDAWVSKIDESYNSVFEKTYAYGDMGAYFDGILEIAPNEYYLTGIAQYQCDTAATILKKSIITKISDHTDINSEEFVDLQNPELAGAPEVSAVLSSAINYNILDGSMANDYALKIYWTDVPGAAQFKVTIKNGGTEIASATTTNFNNYVFKDVLKNYGLVEQIPYTVVVTAIDDKNGSLDSAPFSFTVFNNRYATLRQWYPGFNQKNKQSDFYYRLDSGAKTVDVSRYQIKDDKSTKMRSLSTSSTETIAEDMNEIGYGTYFYRMTIERNDGTTFTIDTPSFNYVDPDPDDLSYINLDEKRLNEDVGLTETDIEALRKVIHLGQFDDGNRHQIRLVQLFINYYMGDLAKLGIYSPETEPESGFDIPVTVNNYYNEDTKKALVYLLAYFGRYNINGERLSDCVDSKFFADIAKLEKQPLRNDIVAAFRSEGSGAKYNSGYTFDTSYNFIEGAKFALPVDHQPMKSAYFGIRYLPIINGDEYDTGVRLHSGLDFRSEDLIMKDVKYIEAHAGESYVDEADQDKTDAATEEKTRREIIRDRIYAPYDGVVDYVDDSTPDVGNGIYVRIKHVSKDAEKTEFYSQYLHLSSIMCEVGQVVKRGEVIGTMGDTGYSEAKHLHIEFYTEQMHVATFINPLIFDYAYEPRKSEALQYEKEHGLDK